ncbi:MAG: thioredoxin family protein [Acholeplasmataceae bacterium]
MERLLNDENQKQIKEMLSIMKDKVNITFFHEENNEGSEITLKLFNELKELNNKINFTHYNYQDNLELAKEYNINRSLSYVIYNDNEKVNGAFYGVPLGHEINTLLTTLVDASNANPLYDEKTLKEIQSIKEPTNIKVFVTTSCPHCPGAAINALRLSKLNKNITSEVYEVQSNMDVGTKYNVSGVPKILINETKELMGNQPITEFLKKINN